MAGNVTDTVMKTSDVNLGVRVPLALIFPGFLFGAIEVLVRIPWLAKLWHLAARGFLLSVAVPTAITSYLHLHDLMVMGGETAVASVTGPLSIDGLMLGCTVALLATRRPALDPISQLAPDSSQIGSTEEASLPEEQPSAITEEAAPEEIGQEEKPSRRHSSRAGAPAWDVVKVVHLLLEGRKTSEVASLSSVSPAVVGRVSQAVRLLRSDLSAEIPSAWKISPAVAQIIRAEMAK